MQQHRHASHPAILKRLRRAHGHLASVIEMMECDRPCTELAQQLHAVESAIANAKRELIHDHIEHCLVEEATGSPAGSPLGEFKQLVKYL